MCNVVTGLLKRAKIRVITTEQEKERKIYMMVTIFIKLTGLRSFHIAGKIFPCVSESVSRKLNGE